MRPAPSHLIPGIKVACRYRNRRRALSATGAGGPVNDRATLRRQLRTARRALPEAARARASEAACSHLLAWCAQQRWQRVAAYLPQGSELDLRPALSTLHQQGIRLLLPVTLARTPCRMVFRPWSPTTVLEPDAWGIPAPPPTAPDSPLSALDLILVPGLGFDARGHRLGSGAGCYDRVLGERPPQLHRPFLLGCGYALQSGITFAVADWDVPLDGLLDEHGVHPLTPP